MIERYQRKIMKKIWSDESKYESWLLVELFSAEAYSKINQKITKKDLNNLWKKTKINVKEIKRIEKTTKHDVIAFIESLTNELGPEKKWIHFGMTSTDVVDTALGYTLKKANNIIKKSLKKLNNIIRTLAIEHKNTFQIGRTHGVHAEITTFGYKMAVWWDETNRNIKRFEDASFGVEVGKISGAVGNYANTPISIQEYVTDKMKINSSKISTQTLQRDRHAHYISIIAVMGASLDKFATELRHLQRTEVKEVEEGFCRHQKGSSAMPHKKNPISSENISGLSRVLKGYVITSLENVSLWHERDISHSSAERIILPNATSLIDYMLDKFTKILSNLVVNKKNMLKNINITKGVVFSQKVMLFLINEKGWSRKQAYDKIQHIALDAINNKKNFRNVVVEKKIITQTQAENIFNLNFYTNNMDQIFTRLNINNDKNNN